ncbi:hypothetical protein ACXR0M_10460 [Pseudomonas sp. Eth.TT006]
MAALISKIAKAVAVAGYLGGAGCEVVIIQCPLLADSVEKVGFGFHSRKVRA